MTYNRAMDFYPKQPDLEKPPILAGCVLVVLQIVAGMVMVGFGALLHVNGGAAFSMVGALAAAMGFSVWIESKVPGALSKRSMLLRFSLIATIAQIVLALIYTAILWFAARSDGGIELPAFWLMALIISLAGGIFFGVTWLGLWQGRRIMEGRRAKA